MAFLKQNPRIFNKANVERLKPNQVGVYGIFNNMEWIYVGKGDIRQRLLDHLNGDNPCILQKKPTHWVGEVIKDDPSFREKELIAELPVSCNKRIG